MTATDQVTENVSTTDYCIIENRIHINSVACRAQPRAVRQEIQHAALKEKSWLYFWIFLNMFFIV